jgi:lysozyme
MNETMSLSAAGLDFIAAQEGFRATVYADAAGHATIGYGHRPLPQEEDFSDGITRDAALTLLEKDAAHAEEAVRGRVAFALTLAEFDALVSFTFNVGAVAFQGSTLLAKLNAGDFAGAADEFLSWDKVRVAGTLTVSRGLANRRRAERDLFLNGVYAASARLTA